MLYSELHVTHIEIVATLCVNFHFNTILFGLSTCRLALVWSLLFQNNIRKWQLVPGGIEMQKFEIATSRTELRSQNTNIKSTSPNARLGENVKQK